MQPQIVHESEVSRQHIRLPIPAHVSIQGSVYPLKDLSSGGFCVEDIMGSFPQDRLLPVTLRLSFPQFTMDIALDSQIQHYNPSTHILGCRFINVAPEQIATINHVLTAYIAGDIVGSSDMLAIASRDNFTKSRMPATQRNSSTSDINFHRQIPGMLLILSLGFGALTLIGANLYGHLFTVKSQDGVVVTDTADIRTQMGGTLNFLIPSDTSIVAEGDNIATVNTGGLMPATTLKSPCNCYIAERLAHNGEYVESEKTILRLIPISAKPWIRATISHKEGSRISMNQKASIKIFGVKDVYDGHVVKMKSSHTQQEPVVLVDVQPDKRVPIDLAERPASIVFYTK